MPTFSAPASAFACQLLAAAVVLSAPAPVDKTFDQPVRTQVVDLGPSPGVFPAQRMILTCFVYPTFTVKQIDAGRKGADLLAIVSAGRGGTPPCSGKPVKGEMEIKDWSGYFKGVKGTLVFFDGDDGYNGGVEFGVYDSRTGMMRFQDSAVDVGPPSVRQTRASWPPRNLRVSRDEHGTVLLNYVRVVPSGSDLNTEGASCWNNIKAKFGLTQRHPPACKGYENVSPRVESVVAYPVLVSLSSAPAVKVGNGPVQCWPQD